MRLIVTFNDDLCGVRADPGQLTTAIINLLANSRDSMGGKGDVTIRIEAIDNTFRDRRWAELAIGRYVSIAIIDRGHGMSADVAREAVTPFFTTKAAAGGTGLGLSTVHGFVVQSGGILLVQSDQRLGTTITVVLPHC
jgi:two-component system cell cycle sensor histidine kinase/response regulator CckA